MKKADLKKKTEKELLKELSERRVAIREFRFGMSGSKTRDTNVGKVNRKGVARILTELHSRANTK